MAEPANELRIIRVFDAPVEKVWAAWSNPEIIQKWWGPKDFTAPHVTVDFRVGGTYLYAMHGPAGTVFDMDMWSGGTYTEIVPMERIAYRDHFADKDGNAVLPAQYGMADLPDEMSVVVEFEQVAGGKTKVTLTHAMSGDLQPTVSSLSSDPLMSVNSVHDDFRTHSLHRCKRR
jgi:uncharacterized protein YndB with AHSA1/START domain